MSDIDDIIKELSDNENKKEIIINDNSKEIDATEDDDLMQEVVKMTIEDRKHADELYNVFLPEVSMGKDHSSASKEAMVRAVELKINAAKNIIELLKVKRMNNQKNSLGVFVGDVMSGKKVGIDINSIKEDL